MLNNNEQRSDNTRVVINYPTLRKRKLVLDKRKKRLVSVNTPHIVFIGGTNRNHNTQYAVELAEKANIANVRRVARNKVWLKYNYKRRPPKVLLKMAEDEAEVDYRKQFPEDTKDFGTSTNSLNPHFYTNYTSNGDD